MVVRDDPAYVQWAAGCQVNKPRAGSCFLQLLLSCACVVYRCQRLKRSSAPDVTGFHVPRSFYFLTQRCALALGVHYLSSLRCLWTSGCLLIGRRPDKSDTLQWWARCGLQGVGCWPLMCMIATLHAFTCGEFGPQLAKGCWPLP